MVGVRFRGKGEG
jgi:hypothetical protein